jgi:hypothetical protein
LHDLNLSFQKQAPLMKTLYRIGQIVPSSNITMETEIPAMLQARQLIRPERFAFHSSRMRMNTVSKEELKSMDPADWVMRALPWLSTCGFSPTKQMRPTPDNHKSVCPTGDRRRLGPQQAVFFMFYAKRLRGTGVGSRSDADSHLRLLVQRRDVEL